MRGSLVVLALLVSPALALAQSNAELIERGVALREAGRDEEALALFEQAYQDAGSGEALAQIALAEQALGRMVESEAHFVSALAEPDDRFVRRHRAALQQALDELRAGLGDLEIHGGTPGLEVWIGEASRGLLPLAGPIRVPLGSVRVELRVHGRVTEGATVEVTHDAVAVLDVPVPVEPVVQVQPAAPDPTPVPRVEAAPPPPSPHEALLLPVGIAAGALGVVLTSVASGLMVLREDSARARLTCSDLEPACRAQFQTAVDSEAAGVALYVAGGLLIAAGAALIVIDALSQDDESTALVCVPGALSVSCAARF